MKTSALKTTLLATLLVAPPAAFLRAGDPPAPPAAPQAAPAPPAAPAAPEAPAPPEAPRARKKRVVVASPEKEIVVDGDRVFISGDDEPDMMADVEGLEEWDGHPFVMRTHGHGGGFIGIQPIEMTPELRQHFGAPKEAGILVGSVESDSPAAKAGLQVGDIVTKVDGDSIESTRELVRLVRHKKGGETITVDVLRNRSARSLKVTVAERKQKEIRIGELPGKMRGHDWNWNWTPGPGHPKVAPLPPDFPDFEQRLDDIEKKLKEIEGRLPSR